jgi:two-component SAPR family response regulator
MLESYPDIEIVASYTDSQAALQEAKEIKPDCAFLDIEMAELSGIELAEKLSTLSPEMEVVFVTAYNHYAAQAFEVNAIDYLLKPIRPERLGKAVSKMLQKSSGNALPTNSSCLIRCFGAFEVVVGGRAVHWSRSKSKELFAYLLQQEGKKISKFRLCDEQWPDYGPEQGLAYLQTSLYALRKSLRSIGCEGIQIEYADDRYVLYVKKADWDVRQFEAYYSEYMKTQSPEAGKKAMELYRGEYLEGEDWLWSDVQRENFICKYETLRRALLGENDLAEAD